MQYSLHDVFISYRRFEDKEKTNDLGTRLAGAIYRFLTKKGLRVFWDDPEMEPGDFEEQLHWQIEHSPNYIFIGTEAAKRFRPDVKDFVAEEVGLALELYHASPNKDRVAIHVLPMMSDMDREKAAEAGPYPDEIQKLMKLHGVELHDELPTDKDLSDILKHVTRVNRGNMWNAGHHWFEQSRKVGHRFASLNINKSIMPNANIQRQEDVRLPIRAHGDDQADLPLLEMIENTPGHLYLIGEGGIGKTTALYSIMEDVYGGDLPTGSVERLRLNGQVPLFVELSRAPDTYGKLYEGGKSTFIHRAVYQQLRQDLSAKQVPGSAVRQLDEVFEIDPETAVNPIHDLFTQQSPAPEYLLLLDGLNEVSRVVIEHRGEPEMKSAVVSMILQEIHQLMTECPNVRVILTSRSKEQTNWGDETTLLYLSGVNDDSVKDYLAKANVSQARIESAMNNEKLRDVLRVPLFLTLYAALDGDEELLTQGEILHLFFHQKKKALYSTRTRIDQVDEDVDKAASAKQFHRLTATMQGFILDFILPEIAWRMEQNDMFHIYRIGDEDEVNLSSIIEHVLTDESDTAVCGRYAEAFEEYLSDSDAAQDTLAIAEDMIERLGGRMRRVVDSILNCAVMTLGILQKNCDEYGFIHHHIRDYFAAVYQINRLKLAVYLQKRKKNELARECLSDWKAAPLHAEVRRFIGEALGEAHNAPVCDDDGNWHYVVPEEPCERNLIKRGFDIYRGRFDGEDGYAVWNLLEIVKTSRRDLSGEDFAELYLIGCSMNGFNLGRTGCQAKFNGSIIDETLLFFNGHIAGIKSVSVSVNGKYILTIDRDRRGIVWDFYSLQKRFSLDLVENAYFDDNGDCVFFQIVDRNVLNIKRYDIESKQVKNSVICPLGVISPDKQHFVTVDDDGRVNMWSLRDMMVINSFRTKEVHRVDYVQYSPDGNQIVVVSGNKVYILKVEDMKVVCETEFEGDFDSLIISKNGCMAILNKRIVWDIQSGKKIVLNFMPKTAEKEVIDSSDTDDWNYYVRSIEFDLKAQRFVIIASVKGCTITGHEHPTYSVEQKVMVWDTDTLQALTMLDSMPESIFEKKEFLSARFTANGYFIVVHASEYIELYNAMTLQSHLKIKGEYSNWIYNCACNTFLACGEKMTEVWNVDTLCKIGSIKGTVPMITTKGDHIITLGHHSESMTIFSDVIIYNAITLQESGRITSHLEEVSDLLYNPAGTTIGVFVGSTLLCFDTKALRVRDILTMDSKICAAAFNPTGSELALAMEDETVRILDLKNSALYTIIEGDYGSIRCVAFDPNGNYIVVSSQKRKYRNYIEPYNILKISLHNGVVSNFAELGKRYKIWKKGKRAPDLSMQISPNGRYLVVGNEATGAIYDMVTLVKAEDIVGRSVWNGDGCRLLCKKSDNNRVVVYDVSYKEEQVSLYELKDIERKSLLQDTSPCYSPDNRWFATVEYDNMEDTTHIWDAENIREIGKVNGKLPCFSADGDLVATVVGKKVVFWGNNNLQSVHTLFIIPDLKVQGVDLLHLHPDSRLSDEVKELLYEYGAIVDERG